MGHLKSADLHDRGVSSQSFEPDHHETSNSKWWLWIVVLAIVAALAFWYHRGTQGQHAGAGSRKRLRPR